MKIFLSWSGEISRRIAIELKEWFPSVINAAEPFVSSEDIRKGGRWLIEISKELKETNFGIICLTPNNLESPWLLFESGALSKSLEEANVCTLLTGGLSPENIEGPLSHFQHTKVEKEDFRKLVSSVNSSLKTSKLSDELLSKNFEVWWPHLLEKIEAVYKDSDVTTVAEREPKELLSEILELSRYIARNIDFVSDRMDPEEAQSRLRKLLGMSVFEIELSVKAAQALKSTKTRTIGQLAQMSEDELDLIHGFKVPVIKEIKDKLDQLGLSLGMKIDERLLD
jgi:hypothetical protein